MNVEDLWNGRQCEGTEMTFQQDPKLIDMLLDMQRCSNFGICRDAQHDPSAGHVPRGFSGATGTLDEVLLIMVMAEPGFPLGDETYSGDPATDLKTLLSSRYLRTGENLIHRNVVNFLNSVFPMFAGNFDELLRRVWLTKSRHCSIAEEIGQIPKRERLICSQKHLVEQVGLFPNAIVLLAGTKAGQARGLVDNAIQCGAFAPPGCNHFKVRQSHADAAEKVRRHVAKYL